MTEWETSELSTSVDVDAGSWLLIANVQWAIVPNMVVSEIADVTCTVTGSSPAPDLPPVVDGIQLLGPHLGGATLVQAIPVVIGGAYSLACSGSALGDGVAIESLTLSLQRIS